MAVMSQENVRPSLVDVFEGYFGEKMESLSPRNIRGLPRNQLDDFVCRFDLFLKSAQKQEYPPETVTLDSLANPIIFADDPGEPKTTRKAKQVALLHREVVIPSQPLGVDYRCAKNRREASRYPVAWLQWTKQNCKLLRSHVISISGQPSVYDVVDEQKLEQLIREFTYLFQTLEFRELREAYIEPMATEGVEESRVVRILIHGFLLDAISANAITGNLAFLDKDSGDFYRHILKVAKGISSASVSVISDSEILQCLALPAIDDIPDHEFVAIRTQSDDFEEFRGALARVLSRTRISLSSGSDLITAFKTNLEEIHIRADSLRRQVKDKALRKFLRDNFQTIALSAIASASASIASDAISGKLLPIGIAAQFITGVSVGTLLNAIFYKPPAREQRLLRFYNVLLNQEAFASRSGG